MRRLDGASLWRLTAASGLSPGRFLSDGVEHVAFADLAERARSNQPPEALRGQSVLISSHRQLPAVLALLALDGIARRVVLCPPDLPPKHLPTIIAEARIDTIISDGTGPAGEAIDGIPLIAIDQLAPGGDREHATEWLLFTSGTTGRPKMVVHSLASLAGPLDDGLVVSHDAIWSTFYDVRRYGGLTILLRALLGGGSLVMSRSGEAIGDFLIRAGQAGVTHISGTPSHWRRALMSPMAEDFTPNYVRLSGEVVDQAILNNLGAAFPHADVAHAFASTEAGFAFDVRDRMAGFPASLVGQAGAKADLRIRDGSLRIRSPRAASRYLDEGTRLADADGFIDTGDMVELRNDRYYFVGRREGIINVGGLKVHPEEIEAVINQHPAVQMARVRGRSSPITGAIVVAEVVLRPASGKPFPVAKQEVLELCRRILPDYKVPAMLYEVTALDIAASGKLVRQGA